MPKLTNMKGRCRSPFYAPFLAAKGKTWYSKRLAAYCAIPSESNLTKAVGALWLIQLGTHVYACEFKFCKAMGFPVGQQFSASWQQGWAKHNCPTPSSPAQLRAQVKSDARRCMSLRGLGAFGASGQPWGRHSQAWRQAHGLMRRLPLCPPGYTGKALSFAPSGYEYKDMARGYPTFSSVVYPAQLITSTPYLNIKKVTVGIKTVWENTFSNLAQRNAKGGHVYDFDKLLPLYGGMAIEVWFEGAAVPFSANICARQPRARRRFR